MVHHYKRKKPPTYDKSKMDKAIAMLKNKEAKNVSWLAKEFGIPPQTLRDRWHAVQQGRDLDKLRKKGGQTVLTKSEEDLIALALVYLAKFGYPQGKDTVRVSKTNCNCI